MSLIIRLIAKYALWIYVLCGLAMLFYLRAALSARREGSQAIYSLEKESAAERVYRSSGMIFLLLLRSGDLRLKNLHYSLVTWFLVGMTELIIIQSNGLSSRIGLILSI